MNTKNREMFEKSTKFFMRALELDPSYSQAYAALSMAYNLDYQNRWSDNPDNSLRLAKHNAEQAIKRTRTNRLPDLSRRGPQFRKGPRSGEVRGRYCAVPEPEFLWSLRQSWQHSHAIQDGRWRRFRRLSAPFASIPLLGQDIYTSSAWRTCLRASTKQRRLC